MHRIYGVGKQYRR